MSIRDGLFVLVAVFALAMGVLSVGTASADRDVAPTDYAEVVDSAEGGHGSVYDIATGGGTKQICETGPSSTTCVGKGWLAAGACKVFGGEIVAGDPGGVFLCEFGKD